MAPPQPSNLAENDRPLRRRFAGQLLGAVIRELGWRYWLFCCATLALASATLLPPELFRTFTTSLKDQSFDTDTVLRQIALFGGLIASILLVTSFLSILFREWLRLNLQANLRRRVLGKLHSMPIEATDEAERGEWLTKMTSDLANVESFMTESIPEQMRDAAIVVGVAILFAWHVGPLAWLPIGTAVFIAFINYWIHKKLAPVLEDLRTLNGRVFQTLIENFEGRKTVRSLGGEMLAAQQFETKLRAIIKAGFRVVGLLGGMMSQNRFISEVMVTVALTAVVWSFGQGQMSIADALIVPFYIGLFFSSAQGLAHAGFAWNRFFAEGGRLAGMLAIPEGGYHHRNMAPAKARAAQRMVARDLSIGYRGRPVAAGISFTVQRGAVLGLIGPSGCGKSTALEVLAGLRRPLGGVVEVWAADDQMLWQTSHPAVLPRALTGYVEQRPYIFAGSIRDNLTFGLETDVCDEELWQVLERVALTGWVCSLTSGLSHVIADRGDNVSEGQRYRLALARVLLTARPFLLLDEPFAALDDISVQHVLKALADEKAKGRGIVVVTHIVPKGFSCDETLDFSALDSKVGTRLGIANFPGPADMPLYGGSGDKNFKLIQNHEEVQHAERDRT